MQSFSFRRLVAVLVVLTLARAVPLAAQQEDISDYLTGEIKHLSVVHRDVNVHDFLLVSAFDKSGKTLERLAEKKGKVLLLTFWSRACLSCRSHMRQLAAAQDELGSDKLEVVAINLDQFQFSRVRKTLDQRGLETLAAYQDHNKNLPFRVAADPDLTFFGRAPKTLIIDPDGNVRATANTRKDWTAPEAMAFFKALQEGRI